MKDMGVIEPYALYAISAFIKEFVVDANKKLSEGDNTDYRSFVQDSVIEDAMAAHCK